MAADRENLELPIWFTWQVTLFFPASAFLKIALTWCLLHNLYLDTQHLEKEEAKRLAEESNPLIDDDQVIQGRSVLQDIPLCRDLYVLLTNPIYLLCMSGQVTLQFAAAGLNFWTISYMKVVLDYDILDATTMFVTCLFSAMIPGVIMGSTLSDKFGGYKGRGMRHAILLCALFGFCATCFSIAMSFVFSGTLFVILMWFFFFFGAGIMPIAGGITIACVPKFAQNSA